VTGQEEVPVPQLMREARDVYWDAIRRAIAGSGCDDLPRNTVTMLTSLDHSAPEPEFSPQADIVAALRLSKQSASQLIDTLVLRQYLERQVDPGDRRRMSVRLTSRGRVAAKAIQAATDAVDAEIARLITADELRGMRAGLAAYQVIRAGLAHPPTT
jgi:DNA-binding MarR family transcriptional regulator